METAKGKLTTDYFVMVTNLMAWELMTIARVTEIKREIPDLKYESTWKYKINSKHMEVVQSTLEVR